MTIKLRHATEIDVPTIYKWWSDGEVMKSVGFPKGLETNHQEVLKSIQAYDKEEAEFLLILDETNQPIGEFCYSKIAEFTFSLGIKIGEPDKQERGYGKEALLQGIERIKRKQQVKKIIIHVDPKNKRAMKLYLSNGFETERIIKDNWSNQLGEKCSTVVLILVCNSEERS